jgi:vacuolar-type H+-ATPase subunit E/Vma4
VEPFRELAMDPDIRRVRTAVGSAFGEFTERREERKTEAARWEQYEREEAAEREKHAQKDAADSASRRVVYEGMKLVEKGGRPWPPPSE